MSCKCVKFSLFGYKVVVDHVVLGDICVYFN